MSVSGAESDGRVARWGKTSEAVEGSLHFTLRPTETQDWSRMDCRGRGRGKEKVRV